MRGMGKNETSKAKGFFFGKSALGSQRGHTEFELIGYSVHIVYGEEFSKTIALGRNFGYSGSVPADWRTEWAFGQQ